jgi:hypothetical protein
MLRAGWGLVWRRQRLLWWVYLLSLVLGFFATDPLVSRIGPVLDNSLASDRLYRAFDLATFGELLMRPSVQPGAAATAGMLFAATFLVLMLLLTGGILKVYNEDRTFATGEFFSAGGEFFWRFVRLMMFLLIVLLPVALLNLGFKAWADVLSDRVAQPAPSVTVRAIGLLLVLFLLMSVRLWFDMAEVHAVAEGEYAMRRALARAWRITRRNFGALFWIYFRLSLLTWLGSGLALWVWVRFVPHQAVNTSLILTQAVVFWWILTRLWQRSSETLWYQEHSAAAEAAPRPDFFAPLLEPSGSDEPPAEVAL